VTVLLLGLGIFVCFLLSRASERRERTLSLVALTMVAVALLARVPG